MFTVQRGSLLLSTPNQDSGTITISAVDTAHSFIIAKTRATSSTNASDVSASVRFTTTGSSVTSLTWVRARSGTDTTIEWQVISSPDIDVQHFYATLAAGNDTLNQTISTVDRSKTFILGTVDTLVNNASPQRYITNFDITSTTNARITRFVTNDDINIAFHVVEFTDSTTVQKIGGNIPNNQTTFSPTITAVDLSRSFIVGHYAPTNAQNANAAMYSFGSTTQVNVVRTGTSGTMAVVGFVVQLPSGFVTQSHAISAVSNPTAQAITAVSSMANAFTLATNTATGTGSNLDRRFITTNLTSTTNVNVHLGDTTDNVDAVLFVVESPTGGGESTEYVDVDAKYFVENSVGIEKGAGYMALASGGAEKDAQYDVAIRVDITKGVAYVAPVRGAEEKDIEYRVSIVVGEDVDLEYLAKTSHEITKGLEYSAYPQHSVTKDAQYKAVVRYPITKGAAYTATGEGQTATTKDSTYRAHVRTAVMVDSEYCASAQDFIPKNVQYRTSTSVSLERDSAYAVAGSQSIERDTQYEGAYTQILEKDAAYGVGEREDIQNDAQYKAYSDDVLEIDSSYSVRERQSLDFDAAYHVYSEDNETISRELRYEVAVRVTMSKGGSYSVAIRTGFQLSGQYEVSSPIRLHVPASYRSSNERDLPNKLVGSAKIDGIAGKPSTDLIMIGNVQSNGITSGATVDGIRSNNPSSGGVSASVV